MSGGVMRPYIGLRVLMGAALLLADGPVLAVVGDGAPDGRERAFALALGARQLIEAAALWRHPTPTALRAGAAVDALHGASTAWLISDPRRRRLAAVNLACAVGFALTGLVLADRVESAGGPPAA